MRSAAPSTPAPAPLENWDAPAANACAFAGPDELLRLKGEYLVPCVYHFYRDPPQIVRGEGCYLFDSEGRRYLDCVAGVSVMNAGHCNPDIIEPAVAQIRTLQHTTSIYLTEPVLRLAERLAAVAPGGLRRSFFCASGSEATEGAMLLACVYTGRGEIVAMTGGLHGRTRWAMTATGLPMWRTDPSPLAGVHHAPFGDVAALRALLRDRRGNVAAVIAEPVQGNGGIVEPPDEHYWPAVREACDEAGALLIFDEVQTGFGRTGRWFASEHWGVAPDVTCISKALGNGFPIAAYMTTDAIAAAFTRPAASTHGGNPVAATAALANLDYHARHDLAGNARARGAQIGECLKRLSARRPDVCGCPRGRGLMLGLPLTEAGAPSPGRADALLEALRETGVLAAKTAPVSEGANA